MLKFLVPVGILVVMIGGCKSSSEDLMPLTEKSHWNYLVRSVNSYTDRLAVSGRVAVDDCNGYELKSNLGISHLGWSHGKLVTDQMAGGRFVPPIVILSPNDKRLVWSGWIDWGDKQEAAKAETTCAQQKVEVNGTATSATRSTVRIKLANRNLELMNWFKPGLGMVRQEQQTNGRVDVILEYLDQS